MMYASEVMTRGVEMVHESTRLDLAARKMKDQNIGFFVVGNGTKPTGCVTDRDLVIGAMARGFDPKQHVVSEVMTRHLLTCEEKTKLTKVIDLMKEHKVYRVVVTDANGDPAGVITLGDLATRVSEDEVRVEKALRSVSQHAH